AAQRAFDKVGYRDIGRLVMARWAKPCLDPRRWRDRLRQGERAAPPATVSLRDGDHAVVARRVTRIDESLPWTTPGAVGAPHETGTPRDAAYLGYAYGGELAAYHSLHVVDVDGAPA